MAQKYINENIKSLCVKTALTLLEKHYERSVKTVLTLCENRFDLIRFSCIS